MTEPIDGQGWPEIQTRRANNGDDCDDCCTILEESGRGDTGRAWRPAKVSPAAKASRRRLAPPPVMPAAPPISLETVNPVRTVVPSAAGAAAGAPGESYCTCGNRRGFSRWRWHRTQCKRHLQEHFLGYPEEFNEWPLGYAVYAHARTQLQNAQTGHLIFYHYDFKEGTSELNGAGRISSPSSECIYRRPSPPSWSSGPRKKPALTSRDGFSWWLHSDGDRSLSRENGS